MNEDEKRILAVAAQASAANCTATALMRFLVGKRLMSIADMKQVYLDAAKTAQSPYDHFGELDPSMEAAAEILNRIAGEFDKRADPRL